MRSPFFTIITVSLNSGERLINTVKTVEKQTLSDYELLIKDGGSGDGSLEELQAYLKERPDFARRVRVEKEKDSGIYDGMNRATKLARGEFYLFLNCGDLFHDETVLEQVKAAVETDNESGRSLIYYGNIYDSLQHTVVGANPSINDFACYRNVPCHQACFYHYSLFEERGYETKYKVRGDYEHFLWSYFCKNARPAYVPVVIADYEGGGFSETKENRKRSAQEHREITGRYMSRGQIFRYRLILALTLSHLRTAMAHSKAFSGFYNGLKKCLYGLRKR